MKNSLVALALAAAVSGCTSVESTTVASNEVVGNGGEAIAVIQANSMGWTLIFHLVDIVTSDLDQIVNKVLVQEAKGMGASRVELKSAQTTPRHGIFCIVGFPGINITSPVFSSAVGVAVK